jgi:hypothetical protein
VQNFSGFFLPDSLSTRGIWLIPPCVNTYLLIFSTISTLSTILYFGAKLISLYLFLAQIREKVADKHVIYA